MSSQSKPSSSQCDGPRCESLHAVDSVQCRPAATQVQSAQDCKRVQYAPIAHEPAFEELRYVDLPERLRMLQADYYKAINNDQTVTADTRPAQLMALKALAQQIVLANRALAYFQQGSPAAEASADTASVSAASSGAGGSPAFSWEATGALDWDELRHDNPHEDDEPIPYRLAEGVKHDAGKSRMDLLPWRALLAVGRVLAFGAAKYAPEAWRRVPQANDRYAAAALRHIAAWRLGEERDPESGELHLAHAACCVLFLLELAEGS